LVVATPVGQLHELGAVIAGAAAASLGWHVTYLGTSLPAVEIAGVAMQNKARAVALSIVYPEDDLHVNQEIRHLGSLMPREARLIVGGRAAPSYRAMLERVQAIICEDIDGFSIALDRLRKPVADA
jgi:methylmalonyl-CoA mutase cobalamin-binding subunit